MTRMRLEDVARVAGVSNSIASRVRFGDPEVLVRPETRDMVLAQAPKRLGLRFVPTRIVSWDHGKLGGVY